MAEQSGLIFDPAAFARRHRLREMPELGVPEGARTYWGEAGLSWLPHPVDELLGLGGVRGYLFAGPEGTGKYTTAIQLTGVLRDRGWKCYYLTGDAMDSLGDKEREAVFEQLLGAQEAIDGEKTGHVVILQFPEDASRRKKLQLALAAAVETCESIECSAFLFVLTEDVSAIRPQLLRKLSYCEFRVPDSEERERYLRSAFEEVFHYTKSGGAAAEQQARTRLVKETEGFSYSQLRQLVIACLLQVKRRTIDKVGYDPESVKQAMTSADFFVLEEKELSKIVSHIRRDHAAGGKPQILQVQAASPAGTSADTNAARPGAAVRPSFNPGSNLQQAYERAVKVGDMMSEMGMG